MPLFPHFGDAVRQYEGTCSNDRMIWAIGPAYLGQVIRVRLQEALLDPQIAARDDARVAEGGAGEEVQGEEEENCS